jgi:predicted NBD/HSP70 family sugar kinase
MTRTRRCWGAFLRGGAGGGPFVLPECGTRSGGAVMVDGRLVRGASGFAGEVGHMKVDPQGRECGCGRRGCWETVAGQRAVALRVCERIAEGRAAICSRSWFRAIWRV